MTIDRSRERMAAGQGTIAGDLTDSSFWDGYWGSFSLPNTIDERHSFDRTLADGLRRVLARASGDVLEVGCAPGRWLAFLSRELGLHVSGIEYTTEGAAATRRNLQLLGIPYGDVRDADFFAVAPSPVYDVVVSFGFVEHFSNVATVFERHAAWLRPGGRLVIGVPNFAGVHGTLQRILDPSVLALHNVSIMSTERLASLGEEAGLETQSVEYLGSFEPSLPISRAGVHGVGELLAKIVLRLGCFIRRSPLIGRATDAFNGPHISSYILASYRKPASRR
jgi:SAM-dependent methyltransferase